jgi:hypothetical protein
MRPFTRDGRLAGGYRRERARPQDSVSRDDLCDGQVYEVVRPFATQIAKGQSRQLPTDARQAEVERLQPVFWAGGSSVGPLPTPGLLAVAPPATPLIARRPGAATATQLPVDPVSPLVITGGCDTRRT